MTKKLIHTPEGVRDIFGVECDKKLTGDDVRLFAEGITSGEIVFLSAALKITGDNTALVEICEGKFHQIKKMFHAIGAEVTSLCRLRIGGVYLDKELKPGQWRELTQEEINLITDSTIKDL